MEMLSLLRKGNALFHEAAGSEMLSGFIIRRAEGGRTGEGFEPQHGAIAPFDATVVLLNMVVEILISTMFHLPAAGAADGFPIGRQFIGHDTGWVTSCSVDSLP